MNIFFRAIKHFHLSSFFFRPLSALTQRKCFTTEEKARAELELFSPNPLNAESGGVCAKNELISPPLYDLQIIVPCYNVEKYVKECIDSILCQKTNYRFIVQIINDGSTDGTLNILEQYRDDPRVEITNQINSGLSAARNSGLAHLSAKYVTFVDSDDFLSENAIESLLSCAYQRDADIVQGNYYRYADGYNIPFSDFQDGPISYNQLPGLACGRIYRSTMLQSLCFPVGFLFEDTMSHFLLHIPSALSYAIHDVIYYYRADNINSISVHSRQSKRSVESYWITELMVHEMVSRGFSFDCELFCKILKQFVINGKRIVFQPVNIQEDIFILQRDILLKFFPNESEDSVKEPYRFFYNAIAARDFGRYSLYLRLF